MQAVARLSARGEQVLCHRHGSGGHGSVRLFFVPTLKQNLVVLSLIHSPHSSEVCFEHPSVLLSPRCGECV